MNSNQQHDQDEVDTGGSSRPDDPDVGLLESGKTSPEHSSTSQRQRQLSDEEDERLADDVLLGAKRIADHLTSILGVPVDEADVYYAHRMKKWPIGKYGALLIASKRRFARHAEKLTRGPTA